MFFGYTYEHACSVINTTINIVIAIALLSSGNYVGGPALETLGTLKSTGANLNKTSVIKVETYHELNLFVSYKLNNNWTLRANIENALDEAYVLGAQAASFIDPSLPRTLSVSSTYKF